MHLICWHCDYITEQGKTISCQCRATNFLYLTTNYLFLPKNNAVKMKTSLSNTIFNEQTNKYNEAHT